MSSQIIHGPIIGTPTSWTVLSIFGETGYPVQKVISYYSHRHLRTPLHTPKERKSGEKESEGGRRRRVLGQGREGWVGPCSQWFDVGEDGRCGTVSSPGPRNPSEIGEEFDDFHLSEGDGTDLIYPVLIFIF